MQESPPPDNLNEIEKTAGAPVKIKNTALDTGLPPTPTSAPHPDPIYMAYFRDYLAQDATEENTEPAGPKKRAALAAPPHIDTKTGALEGPPAKKRRLAGNLGHPSPNPELLKAYKAYSASIAAGTKRIQEQSSQQERIVDAAGISKSIQSMSVSMMVSYLTDTFRWTEQAMTINPPPQSKRLQHDASPAKPIELPARALTFPNVSHMTPTTTEKPQSDEKTIREWMVYLGKSHQDLVNWTWSKDRDVSFLLLSVPRCMMH